jgi:transposase
VQGRELERRPGRADRLQRGDLLAAAAGLDRGRCLAPAARGSPDRTAGCRSFGHGRRRDRRLARQGPQRGAHTGPSPVDRGRPGSKHHLVTDRHGTPLAVTLTSGNRHDITQLIPLLDAIPSIRGLRGRPRRRPKRLFADRGYDFDKYRRIVRARGITPKIARRGAPHGSGLGKTRWVVERTFAWLHQFKRLRIRYEIHADLHLGLLQLACSIIGLRRLRTSF